jgi:cyclopropane-fatty-acyl-phospholipid synthase
MSAGLSLGRVLHTRHVPLVHSFSYPLVFGVFDVEELSILNGLWPLAGYNCKAVLAIHDRDYLGDGPGRLPDKWHRLLAGRPVAGRVLRTELITVPRVLGYSYNPVNFYLGHDAGGAIVCAAAEINNTYGERHLYVLDEPLPGAAGPAVEFLAPKDFFVSPFFDLRGEYRFSFHRSEEEVDARVVLHREGRPALSARLVGQVHPLTRGSIVSTLLRSPLSAALTMPRITWQALKLKRKGLRGLLKPEPTSPMTIRRIRRKAPA